ncbi:MAG: hypothetical protein ACPGAN_05215 [Candidatus Poseidoniaceae archaeon]
MRKALAQNPNLLRTLLGLSFTLIFILGYAVYGATVSPSYYLYDSDTQYNSQEVVLENRIYNSENNKTTWTWQTTLDTSNLTWVNFTLEGQLDTPIVTISNAGGLFYHEDLGNPEADDFSCAEMCQNKTAHDVEFMSGDEFKIHTLGTVDASKRNNGTVFAKSIDEAWIKADESLSREHGIPIFRVSVVENGDQSIEPVLIIDSENEQLNDVVVFSVDAATELVWAFAAVVGCFSILLVPSFMVYFVSREKEKKVQAKLDEAEEDLINEIDISSDNE